MSLLCSSTPPNRLISSCPWITYSDKWFTLKSFSSTLKIVIQKKLPFCFFFKKKKYFLQFNTKFRCKNFKQKNELKSFIDITVHSIVILRTLQLKENGLVYILNKHYRSWWGEKSNTKKSY